MKSKFNSAIISVEKRKATYQAKGETVLLLITVSEVLFVNSVFPRAARTVAVIMNLLSKPTVS